MQVFKAGIRIVAKHPLYLLIYTVFLSFMGVFMASSLSFGAPDDAAFAPYDTKFSVIDRDGSALSAGLAGFLDEQGTEVALEDTGMALQDAVAKRQSAYTVIVPEGFGEAFAQAARTGGKAPVLDTVYSYYSAEGSLMDQQVAEYLGIAWAYAGLVEDAPLASIAQHAGDAMRESAQVESVQVKSGSPESQRFVFYLQWGTYTMFASIIVCVGVLSATLNRTDLRRRNLVAPMPLPSYGLQVGAAGFLVMAAVWLWSLALGFAVFGDAAAQISGPGLALMTVASFAFATVPLSVGHLLGQLGVSEFASNAIGNIAGMVISFLGGAWVSFDLLDPAVQAVAHFSPAYWYTNALQSAADMGAATPEAVLGVAANIGMLLLFTAAIFAIAAVAGRLRRQSAEAGGNAAAEAVA